MFPTLHEQLAEGLDAVLRDSLDLAVRPPSGLAGSGGLRLVSDDPSDQGASSGARKNRTFDLILIRADGYSTVSGDNAAGLRFH
jgi:hypothetical protein